VRGLGASIALMLALNACVPTADAPVEVASGLPLMPITSSLDATQLGIVFGETCFPSFPDFNAIEQRLKDKAYKTLRRDASFGLLNFAEMQSRDGRITVQFGRTGRTESNSDDRFCSVHGEAASPKDSAIAIENGVVATGSNLVWRRNNYGLETAIEKNGAQYGLSIYASRIAALSPDESLDKVCKGLPACRYWSDASIDMTVKE
jgi:hypothetical protein